jgi:predicted PurR-regulated permease PerM
MDRTDSTDRTDNHHYSPSNGPSKRGNLEKKRLSVGETVLIGIFIILLFFVLKYAAVILMPLTFAILLSLLLTPVVHFLSKWHIPKRIGAAIVVASIVSVIAGAIIFLSEPAEEWLDKSPQILQEIEQKLQKIKEPLEKMQRAAEKMDGLAEMDNSRREIIVKSKSQKLFDTIFSATPEVLTFLVLSIVLLYFLLYSGKTLVEYSIRAIFWLANQHDTVNMGHLIQKEISRYLLTITVINSCLGIIVTVAFALIGLPNPVLWGTMAALLNFAPYIGAICTAIVITLISFVTFDTLSQIFLAPAVFLGITSLEGHFITPQILGDRFSMNPLLVFLSIIVWGWIWGYVGALLAFPLLVSAKIICRSVDVLRPFADFLEET